MKCAKQKNGRSRNTQCNSDGVNNAIRDDFGAVVGWLASDGKTLWVFTGAGQVARLDPATNSIGALTTIALPFYFATSEAASLTGVACTTGCTVNVPALSQRVLLGHIVYRTGTAFFANGPAFAVVTP